jgi:hypothetical protein
VAAAASTWMAAEWALMETAPTTRAGLRAFESYLREGSRSLRQRIGHTVTRGGLTFTSYDGSQESVDFLIAKLAAEIDAAA